MNRAGHCWRCEAPCATRCARCKVAYYCSKPCQKQDKWRHEPQCDAAEVTKTCNVCGRTREGLQKCSSCLAASYCSAECQKVDWENHKTKCHKTVEKTLQMTYSIKALLTPRQDIPGARATYYWGNIPAVDLINLPMNEGKEYSNPLALLLCGVGDPRNILLSVASLPDVYKQQVTFVLNDICPCTLARTVLLLYMLYRGGSDVAVTVIRVWYSLYISERDHNMLTSALQELITTTDLRTLTEGVMGVTADHLKQLQTVWLTWSMLSQRRGAWVARVREEAISRDVERESGINHYLHAIPREHRKSVKEFFETGLFNPKKDTQKLSRQNVTLTGRSFLQLLDRSEFYFSTPTDVLPFTGWDYKEVKKVCHVDSLPVMYGTYLSEVLINCRKLMRTGQVKLHSILGNCVDIEPFLPVGLRYDRISTSNLWDYISLTALLTKFKCYLNNENSYAVLLTETQNWPCNFGSEIFQLINDRSLPLFPFNLTEKALKDTRNPELVHSSGLTSSVEYQNLTSHIVMNLHAALLAAHTDKELASFARKKILPSIKSIAAMLGFKLRDFVRNENSVFPFKWAINCRRVTMLRGFEHALEWQLLP